MLAKITRIKDGKWISLSDCIRMSVDNNNIELIFTLNSSSECGSTLYLMELENYIYYTEEGFKTIVLSLSDYEIVIDNAQELKEQELKEWVEEDPHSRIRITAADLF